MPIASLPEPRAGGLCRRVALRGEVLVLPREGRLSKRQARGRTQSWDDAVANFAARVAHRDNAQTVRQSVAFILRDRGQWTVACRMPPHGQPPLGDHAHRTPRYHCLFGRFVDFDGRCPLREAAKRRNVWFQRQDPGGVSRQRGAARAAGRRVLLLVNNDADHEHILDEREPCYDNYLLNADNGERVVLRQGRGCVWCRRLPRRNDMYQQRRWLRVCGNRPLLWIDSVLPRRPILSLRRLSSGPNVPDSSRQCVRSGVCLPIGGRFARCVGGDDAVAALTSDDDERGPRSSPLRHRLQR